MVFAFGRRAPARPPALARKTTTPFFYFWDLFSSSSLGPSPLSRSSWCFQNDLMDLHASVAVVASPRSACFACGVGARPVTRRRSPLEHSAAVLLLRAAALSNPAPINTLNTRDSQQYLSRAIDRNRRLTRARARDSPRKKKRATVVAALHTRAAPRSLSQPPPVLP